MCPFTFPKTERSWARILKRVQQVSLGRQEAPNIYGITVFQVELCPSKKKKKEDKKKQTPPYIGGTSLAKTPCLNAWDLGLIPRWGGSPGRRKWQPAAVFLPGECHGQRSIPESDTTKATEHACTQETRFCLLETHMLHLKKQDATTKTDDPTGCN